MSFERARAVADAVLFEGYALYPYRASSLKNRARLAIGSLYPRSSRDALGGFEPWELACDVLVRAGDGAALEGVVRFLHAEARGGGGWESAVPREVSVGPILVEELISTADAERAVSHVQRFSFGEGETAVDGEVEVSAGAPLSAGVLVSAAALHEALDPPAVLRKTSRVHRVTLRVRNFTPLPESTTSEDARRRALGAAHALLHVRGGSFVSLIDPPADLAAAAATCRNSRVWPVLAGETGSDDVVLCSPILLEDHPRVAPESPAALFDATEMDEMLALRILTMTDEEKREAAALDERVRATIERVNALAPEDLARLHGAVRELRRSPAELRPGDRVILRPNGRADILDLALAGLTATVSSILQDLEGRVFVTVLVDDDPGRDLGASGFPGHRFFFRLDEVEPLG